MRRHLVKLAVLTAAGVLVYRSLPDIKRYLKIRQM
ncbi:DUF6893 family small protein [Sphaerisporangium rubeum]|uniref:Uncharacterized protein n=1 Tax=Sphaerisporangium rubeum TaxID=321317 RepID=A0A7X0II14_9ACTN|nr:hypothetical protein [Sphaerisporangium rubeum]